MELSNLKGKTILIGKEPGQGRLCITVMSNGKQVNAVIGTPGSVPNSVSRCKDGTAHCKIDVDQSGNMVLVNMKPQNVTYVDGLEIESKKIDSSSIVSLGKDKYNININTIIDAVSKMVQEKEFDISHLEMVWNEYKEGKKDIKAKQRKINLSRTLCSIFTMCAMPCIYFFGKIGYVLTGIGVIGTLIAFFCLKNDNSEERMDELAEDFQDRYVCPNPDCHRFLGNVSYKFLKKNYSMHCPYCKCEYIER